VRFRQLSSSKPEDGKTGETKHFKPTNEYQHVEDNHVCPPGLEYKIDVTTNVKMARILQNKEVPGTPGVEDTASVGENSGKPPPPPPRKSKRKKGRLGASKAEYMKRLEDAQGEKSVFERMKKNKQAPTPPSAPSKTAEKETAKAAAPPSAPTTGKAAGGKVSHAAGKSKKEGAVEIGDAAQESTGKNGVGIAGGLILSLLVAAGGYAWYKKDDDEFVDELPSALRSIFSGPSDDSNPTFDSLEDYERWKKKNQYNMDNKEGGGASSGASSGLSLVERERRGEKLTMKERLKMYEEGLVEIDVPSVTSTSKDASNALPIEAAEETSDNIGDDPDDAGNDADDAENYAAAPSNDTVVDDASPTIPEKQDTRTDISPHVKPLEKPKWMRERDGDDILESSKSLIESGKLSNVEEEVRQNLDAKQTIINGLNNILARKREEERVYRRRIGIRSKSTLFASAPKHGRNAEETAVLQKFAQEKAALKQRIKEVRAQH
jgi:hypothetical protein